MSFYRFDGIAKTKIEEKFSKEKREIYIYIYIVYLALDNFKNREFISGLVLKMKGMIVDKKI